MNEYRNTEIINPKLLKLHTEMRNPDTVGIADASAMEMVRMINNEDKKVALRVEEALPSIAAAIDYILPRMEKGGRMVYMGAGTSARLGFADAAECPPTYGVKEDTVTCIMAGGRNCVFKANESIEDLEARAVEDLKEFGLTPLDTVVAVAASGRTPYCVSALKYAASIGAGNVAIACNPDSEMGAVSDIAIEIDTGAEAVMGSTRMKAGTAEKMVMNMLSTCLMIKLGRIGTNILVKRGHYKNNNTKIIGRRIRTFAELIQNNDLKYAKECLEKANGCCMCAALVELCGLSYEKAEDICVRSDNNFGYAMKLAREEA